MEYAEIQRFVNGNSNSGDCIALQLSDRLLFQSVEIIKNLDRARNAFVVLGDTSFGSCCVDEIAAMHGNAKAIVHFGYACLSRNNRLPVFYAFGREELDLDVRKIAGLAEEWEAVVLDQCFLYMEAEIKQQMVNVKRFGRDGLSKDQRGKVLFVQSREFGQDGSPLLKDLMLNFANYEFFVYRNDTKEVSENPAEPVRKWLMRRYYLIEKAKDAQIIGIIAGTLVVDRYMEMIDRVKMLIRKAKKKYYLLLMGKINEPKLANFLEFDIYVNIACPFSAVIDTYDFVKDVITPLELEYALNENQQWTGEYSTSFASILDHSEDLKDNENEEDSNNDSPRFSLIQRKLVGNSDESNQDLVSENSLQVGNSERQLLTLSDALASAKIFEDKASERTFKGLEQKIGEDKPEIAQLQYSGIAREYKKL